MDGSWAVSGKGGTRGERTDKAMEGRCGRWWGGALRALWRIRNLYTKMPRLRRSTTIERRIVKSRFLSTCDDWEEIRRRSA